MFHVKEIFSKFERAQWIHYERDRNHKERRGADDGLLLIMFNHIDRSDIPNLIEPLSRSSLTKKEQLLSKYSDQSVDFERILIYLQTEKVYKEFPLASVESC